MSEQERDARRSKLDAIRRRVGDAYPPRIADQVLAATGRMWSAREVRETYESWDAERLGLQNPRVPVSGRITAIRRFGRLSFLDLVDNGDRIQISVDQTAVEPVRELLSLLDVGDFIAVAGNVWRTKKNELTIGVGVLQVLAKALRPLPEKWHGLNDVEARYRQRYLDLLSNKRAREIALLRSRTLSTLRHFLDGRGFLEVETPVLQPLYGGAAARPFTTHHHIFDQNLYLRISDELYLKRLVIGGLNRVYEIAHNFRNEGISHKHSPEFTMLECYQAFADYRDMMDLVQGMLQDAAQKVLGTLSLPHGSETIELTGEWPRKTMYDAIKDKTGIDIKRAVDLATLSKALRLQGIDPGDPPNWAFLVDDVFSRYVEPGLIQPTFITHHPTPLSPLAKQSPEDPNVVERFELFIGGMEVANAFSELNDPDEQRKRFDEQRSLAAAGDAEAHPMDEDFLVALEHGMPPTGGLGVGIDRVVRLFADAPNLREVILFPHLRPEGA